MNKNNAIPGDELPDHKKEDLKKIIILPQGVKILYEDRDIIAIHKPGGLLTMGTAKEKFRTAYSIVSDYLYKRYRKGKVFIVHRLDRETSGVVLFAKSEKAKEILQEGWEATEKTYIAAVHGQLAEKEGILESYLTEHGPDRVYSTKNKAEGKLSRTQYQVISENREMSLLRIRLLTGRKHQIRVQFADLGHPVAGDPKYGKSDSFKTGIGLHSWSLAFEHPVTRKKITITADLPPWTKRFQLKVN